MSEEKKVEQEGRGAISEHDAKGLEIIASWMDRDGLIQPAEFLRGLAARAASTSANVAQLDMSLEARLTDAEADVKRLHAEKMELWNQVHGYSANVAQGAEAVAWFTDDSQSDKSATTWDRNVAERWRTKGWPVSPLYAAPPAQTALTDAAIEAGWHQTFSTNNPYCPCNLKSFTKAVQWAERALTAAQSGVKS